MFKNYRNLAKAQSAHDNATPPDDEEECVICTPECDESCTCLCHDWNDPADYIDPPEE